MLVLKLEVQRRAQSRHELMNCLCFTYPYYINAM